MTRSEASAPRTGFTVWRLALWLVLLLAAFGALQYSVHAQRVWSVLGAASVDPAGRAALHTMLAWDVGYFFAAATLLVLCAAAILRQGWARPLLRVVLAVLALGLLASGGLLYQQWMAWSGLPHAADAAIRVAEESRRVHVSLAFDLLGAALLAWLVWQLGRPAVRLQFRHRPPSRKEKLDSPARPQGR